MFSRFFAWAKQQRAFWLYLLLGTMVRFVNFQDSLYFIWDQGRDAWVLQRLAGGDAILVGPTSGLQGFFLGPLWYYVGLPGYWLGQGSPYGIALWYIFLSTLALPLFWFIAHRLFSKQKHWALLTALALAFLPGSIEGSLQIWNPLISLPLVAAFLLSILYARQSRWALVSAFFFMALTLQSEFAYAVFFIVPLWLLIPWIRQKLDWRDFVSTAAAMSITVIPQLVFELRNSFIMTRSLWSGILSSEKSVSWAMLWEQRPDQLFGSTRLLLFGTLSTGWMLMWVLIGLAVWVGWHLWQQTRSHNKPDLQYYQWRLVFVLSVLPYIFYMFWRGNYGYFFSYYITPHFIFLVPLLMYGLYLLSKQTWHYWGYTLKGIIIAALYGGTLVAASLNTLQGRVLFVENSAGLKTMQSAIDQLYHWQAQDDVEQATFRIYTPNAETEHYDYLMHHTAKKNSVPVPLTIRNESTHTWYLLMEPDEAIREKRFLPWYNEATQGGVLVREERFGILKLETWMKHERAAERGLKFDTGSATTP